MIIERTHDFNLVKINGRDAILKKDVDAAPEWARLFIIEDSGYEYVEQHTAYFRCEVAPINREELYA